jgi:hypothetical protein
MAYTIYRADGTLVSVPDNAIDQTFYNPAANGPGIGMGIQLNGRNAIDYGAPTAQTLLQMTENFASNNVLPSDGTSLVGQLWFNKTTSSLFVKVTTANVGAANWRKIAVVDPVVAGDGDIQVLPGPVINIWANGAWQQIFPAVYS